MNSKLQRVPTGACRTDAGNDERDARVTIAAADPDRETQTSAGDCHRLPWELVAPALLLRLHYHRKQAVKVRLQILDVGVFGISR